MAFKSWNSFGNFASEVKFLSRYGRSEAVEAFLAEVERTSEARIKEIPKGRGLFRAQRGNAWRVEDENVGEIPAPYPPERMVPRDYQASEGRANAKGIPHLYMASDKDTAMAEVRPFLGSQVSLALLETTKTLKVVDCSLNHLFKGCFYFEEPSDAEKEKVVWSHIDREFSRPVVSTEDTADYVPTQIIAEIFRYKGFDGIVYKSMLGDGFNIVSFELKSAILRSCHLYEVKSVKFDFQESPNPYFIR